MTPATRLQRLISTLLRTRFGHGKPIVVTEFGTRLYRGAETSGTLGFGVVDHQSVLLHQLPLVGRFVRPRLRAPVRDEALQAREITEALGILEAAGVNGALVCTFVEPIAPFSENPTPCPSPEVGPVVASGLRKRQSRCRVRT